MNAQHSFLLSQEPKLLINHRILANINGKPISVMDIMKKMDVIFFRQYPQFRESIQARAQFYQTGWKEVLQQLIDKELIVADADEAHLEVSNGDIRQEMETMFGPNIIENLDKISLTFDDAWSIIKDEIVIRRMLYYRVNSKALKKITPQLIHEAYDEFAKNNPRKCEWRYSVISAQDKNSEKSKATSELIHELVTKENVPLEELVDLMQQRGCIPESTRVNVSHEYTVTEGEIAESHKAILAPLTPKTFSLPIAQTSRSDHSTIYRIFYLNEMTPGGSVPFEEVETKLIQHLTEEAIAKETEAYLKKLRHHFRSEKEDFKGMIPPDFQPFVMK